MTPKPSALSDEQLAYYREICAMTPPAYLSGTDRDWYQSKLDDEVKTQDVRGLMATIDHLQAENDALARQLENQKNVVDAAVAWQKVWSNEGKTKAEPIQGYLYDRVRHYRKRIEAPPTAAESEASNG